MKIFLHPPPPPPPTPLLPLSFSPFLFYLGKVGYDEIYSLIKFYFIYQTGYTLHFVYCW